LKVDVDTNYDRTSKRLEFVLSWVPDRHKVGDAVTVTSRQPSPDWYAAVRKAEKRREPACRRVLDDGVVFIKYRIRRGVPEFEEAFRNDPREDTNTKIPRFDAEEILRAVGVPVGDRPDWQHLLSLLGFLAQPHQ
jgi:hypothetical protein